MTLLLLSQRLPVFLLSLLLLLTPGFSFAEDAPPPDLDPAITHFHSEVDTLVSKYCPLGVRVGAKFYSLDRKEVIYARNSDVLFSPASNMKMFTSVMALKKVGPDYRFHTRLYTNGKIQGTVIKGDLFIKGFGDPSLVTEQMWILVNELKNFPITRVEGNIIADNTYFDGKGRPSTWKSYRGSEAYLASPGALSFNFNTVTVHVGPGDQPGDKAQVIVDPDIGYFQVDNDAVTTQSKRSRRKLIVTRLERKDHDLIVVKGRLPQNVGRKKFYLNVTDPEMYTASAFSRFLSQAGVKVTGTLKRGVVPEYAKLLVDHESPPLGEILRGLNKYSNNFMAEQILKTLGAQFFGEPGTIENGLLLMQDYMQGLGYTPDQYSIVDGSGLSKINRVTPDMVVALLEDAHSDLSIFPEFISALGVMGVDGSVEDRMRHSQDAQKIRVKTGTLNNVSALSGYFQSNDGERFAFSILLNELQCSNSKATRLQDEIMAIALKFQREDSLEDEGIQIQYGGGIQKQN